MISQFQSPSSLLMEKYVLCIPVYLMQILSSPFGNTCQHFSSSLPPVTSALPSHLTKTLDPQWVKHSPAHSQRMPLHSHHCPPAELTKALCTSHYPIPLTHHPAHPR